MLCVLAAYVLKEYLANPVLIVFVYPVLFFFSCAGAIRDSSCSSCIRRKKLDQWLMWTIMASICGNMVGIAFVAGLATLRRR